MTMPISMQQYLAELNARVPQIAAQLRRAVPSYAAVERGARVPSGRLSGLGQDAWDDVDWSLYDTSGTYQADTSTASDTTSWIDTLGKAAATILPVYQQQQLFEANLELAKQGKTPISPSSVAPQYQFGLTNNTLLLIGGVALAFILLSK
jgi:hypothetical protein